MGLRAETVARVRAYWSSWEAQTVLLDRVSVVTIGDERFTCAPEQLRGRVDRDAPTALSSLVESLGEAVDGVVGEARLAYTDDANRRPVATDGATRIGDDDARLATLRAASAAYEWSEAGADESCDFRCGVVDNDSLLAVATLRIWEDALGHLGVFTAAHARGRGLASKVGGTAAAHAFTLGLVPQWRSRVGNEASARVADQLGFVDLGRQMTVRVKF